MTEHNSDEDITDQIDAVLADAATWNAADEHPRPGWMTPEPGAMTAVELTMSGAGLVDISEAEPEGDIARRIGDPAVNRISHLRRVQFWVGDTSAATSPVNTPATRFLHELLTDVRDGRYIASDAERDHARALLAEPDSLPVIHGPCLVTGVGDGGSAAPLEDNFHSWFTGIVARGLESLINALAREIGIPPEQISHIAVIPLG